jgi:heme exporter protein B
VSDFIRPIVAIVWKDVLLESRSRDIVIAVLIFALLVMVTFNFAIDPQPQIVALTAPGILWVAFVFGGVLGLTRSFSLEQANGNMHGLMLAPVSRDTIFFGKLFSTFLFMLVVEAIAFPLFAVIFNFSMLEPGLVPIALLATLGIATTGTLFSALAVNTRAREVMLPVLFLPVTLPAIIGAVEATGVVLRAEELSAVWEWVPVLAVFDAVFLVICPFAFHMLIED